MTVQRWKTETLDPTQTSPNWFDHDDAGGHVRFLDAAEPIPDGRSDSPELVAHVDFDTDRLLYLAGSGPDARCHRLVVDDVSLVEEALSIDAHVDCESGMAAQAITYPASVLWVPDVSATRVTASITDGWERTHTDTATLGRSDER